MRLLLFPMILITSLSACAKSPEEARAAAILDAAKPVAVTHAEQLTKRGVPAETRRTGLQLITLVMCWPDGCAQ